MYHVGPDGSGANVLVEGRVIRAERGIRSEVQSRMLRLRQRLRMKVNAQ